MSSSSMARCLIQSAGGPREGRCRASFLEPYPGCSTAVPACSGSPHEGNSSLSGPNISPPGQHTARALPEKRPVSPAGPLAANLPRAQQNRTLDVSSRDGTNPTAVGVTERRNRCDAHADGAADMGIETMVESEVGTVGNAKKTGLVLPELLSGGLAANDRLKYYLTLLQAAKARAQQPHQRASDLHIEREAAGVADPAFDEIVSASSVDADGTVWIPSAQRVCALLIADLRQMLQPIQAAAEIGAAVDARVDGYTSRLDALIAGIPSCAGDRLTPEDIDRLTRLPGGDHDSVHKLTMDLHRELNRLQAFVFRESVDGAKTYGLTDADRALVSAFMAGVNETAPLRFDHPGLGTTATRSGDDFSIQNDLGTTDAHVVVIHISDLTATLIYTDIHSRRLRFFQDLLQPCGFTWQTHEGTSSGGYDMTVGRLIANDRDTLARQLTFLGSRLVFVIDWNRARKRLRRFVRNADAMAILKWAADHDVGHRAFMQAGDARLIYNALERAARAQIRYGARLDEILGREPARTFLMATLRIASDGLRTARSLQLIEDEVEAELLTHLHTTELSAMALAGEHAMLITAIAERLRHALMRARSGHQSRDVVRAAELAAAWDARAREMVGRSRRLRDRSATAEALGRLVSQADSAARSLQETAFLLTLLPPESHEKSLTILAHMADVAADCAKEYVRCLEYAKDLPRQPVRADLEEILVGCDRIAQLERESDGARRRVSEQLIRGSGDFRELHVMSEIARSLARSADALAQCGAIVRGYVLTEVSSP